jgi:DNA mismatch endonuclease, patch repair protein
MGPSSSCRTCPTIVGLCNTENGFNTPTRAASLMAHCLRNYPPLPVSFVMADRVSSSVRSFNMAAVRSKNTKPEKLVRSRLFRAGYRFRLHRGDLPGRPDIILPRYRIAIFVHGCFWHGHACRRGQLPSTNVDFWFSKISANKARDAANVARLADDGWFVSIIWTCTLDPDVDALLAHLESISRRRAVQPR